MKFLEIEIKGYKRLSLNKIETISIKFDKKFHWVLGSNGSGKSSLIREFSPLAANHQQYHKGGYKKLTLTFKGKTYVLISDFTGPKNIFSFGVFENGEIVELNPGHTSTVYNNLVLQYFGLTKEIHEFCLGLRNFTSLSPNDRKVWMTRFSDADYTYALNYFKRLYSNYKELQGSIKTDRNRIVEMRGKMIGKEEVKLLEDDLKLLKEKAQFLIEVCPNPTTPSHVVKGKLKTLEAELVSIKERTQRKLRDNRELLPYGDEEELLSKQRYLESRIFAIEDNTKQSFTRLDEVQKETDRQSSLEGSDLASVQEQIIKKDNELKVLYGNLSFTYLEDPQRAFETHGEWLSKIEQIAPELIEDSEDDLNEENYHVNRDKLSKFTNYVHELEVKRSEAFTRLQEAKNCEHETPTECPECKHRWIPGKTPADIYKLETFLEESKSKLEKAKAFKETLEEEVQRYHKFKTGLEYLNNLVWEHPCFKPFWEKIFHEKAHLKNPLSLVNQAFGFQNHIRSCLEIKEASIELNRLLSLSETLKTTNVANMGMLLEESKRLESFIEKAYTERDGFVDQLQLVKQKLSMVNYLKKVLEDTKAKKKELDDFYLLAYEHDQREKLSDLIISTNAEIMQKEKMIRSIEIQQAQIEMLERNLSETEEFAKALKLAVDSLSPSTGLIAKGLTGFINHFTGLVNKLIEKVWLYPMQVIPVLPDEDNNIELDYKFMVKVRDEESPDIAETSSGQQEIINLAYRIVGMTFLGFDSYPLFLDEFGARMDTAHKASAFDMISKLLTTSNFSQVFMISHFEGTQTQCLDADITVLCDANLQLPNGVLVNQVTKIN